MRLRFFALALLLLLIIPAARADRVVDYDDTEYYRWSTGFSKVYTKDGKTVRIVRAEGPYYYEVDLDAEVASAYYLGNTDCVDAIIVDQQSVNGFQITQVGDDMESCLGYAGDIVEVVMIRANVCYRIADYAFQACDSFGGEQNCVTSVILPWNLQAIGKKAFEGQVNLERIYIPKRVTSMGEDCIPPQTTIVCHRNSCAAAWARENGRKYEIIEDGFARGEGIYRMPAQLMSISEDAFDNTPVKYVILPDSVPYVFQPHNRDIIYFYDDPSTAPVDTFVRNNDVNLAFLSDLDE